MPIWLRRFTYKKIEEYYQKQNEEISKQQNQLNPSQKKNDIQKPAVPTPTYKTKGTKK
jgi:hypothetical protein